MYSTKRLNKNMVEGDQFNHIGDHYRDPKIGLFRDLKAVHVPFRTKILPENDALGFFKKLDYSPSEYKERVMYAKKQPLETRRQGFGSRDASRRDEFTSTASTERYREVLRKEMKFTLKPAWELLENMYGNARPSTAPASPSKGHDFPYRVKVTNYDLGRNQVTEFDPKSTRDRHYKMAKNREKVTGIHRPSSADFGRDVWKVEHKLPEQGAHNVTKQFFDKSHIKL